MCLRSNSCFSVFDCVSQFAFSFSFDCWHRNRWNQESTSMSSRSFPVSSQRLVTTSSHNQHCIVRLQFHTAAQILLRADRRAGRRFFTVPVSVHTMPVDLETPRCACMRRPRSESSASSRLPLPRVHLPHLPCPKWPPRHHQLCRSTITTRSE